MKLKGGRELENKLSQMSAKLKRNVAGTIAANANDIASDAQRRAPSSYKFANNGSKPTNGEINQSIAAIPVDGMEWKISVNSKMAAYAEFGTGAYIDIPKGWEGIAWSYYVNGKGLILPTPFFYPAWRDGQEKFMKDLDNELNNVLND